MADQTSTATNNNAAANGTATAKRERKARNNHNAAEIVINSVETAQEYVTQVNFETRGDTANRMFNKSGFTTPANLVNEGTDTLIRLGLPIIAALAAQSTQEGEDGENARNALSILGEYVERSAQLQAQAARFQKLVDAARAMDENFAGTDIELVDAFLNTQGKPNWETYRQTIGTSGNKSRKPAKK